MAKRIKRTLRIRITQELTTVKSYKKFKKEFPDAVYIRKEKVYLFPTEENILKITKVKLKPKKKKEYVIETIIKKPKKVKKPKKIKPEVIIERRFRKQVVLNYKSSEEPYSVSIRAITINPEINERGLLIAVQETKSELSGINFDNFTSRYLGFEQTEIPVSEDKRLNDYRVHVEVFIRKSPPINFIK